MLAGEVPKHMLSMAHTHTNWHSYSHTERCLDFVPFPLTLCLAVDVPSLSAAVVGLIFVVAPQRLTMLLLLLLLPVLLFQLQLHRYGGALNFVVYLRVWWATFSTGACRANEAPFVGRQVFYSRQRLFDFPARTLRLSSRLLLLLLICLCLAVCDCYTSLDSHTHTETWSYNASIIIVSVSFHVNALWRFPCTPLASLGALPSTPVATRVSRSAAWCQLSLALR